MQVVCVVQGGRAGLVSVGALGKPSSPRLRDRLLIRTIYPPSAERSEDETSRDHGGPLYPPAPPDGRICPLQEAAS